MNRPGRPYRVVPAHNLAGSLVFGLALVGVVGCSGQEQAPLDASGSSASAFSEPMLSSEPSLASVTPDETAEDDEEIPYFYGTGQEWVQAQVDCFERAGYHAEPGPWYDSPSFTVPGLDSAPEEEQYAMLEQCYEEVGELYQPPATEESVTAEWEWSTGQYNCLVEAGFDVPAPPSLESWLDEWRQRGYIMYDPMFGLIGPDNGAALMACPRTTETWPAQ